MCGPVPRPVWNEEQQQQTVGVIITKVKFVDLYVRNKKWVLFISPVFGVHIAVYVMIHMVFQKWSCAFTMRYLPTSIGFHKCCLFISITVKTAIGDRVPQDGRLPWRPPSCLGGTCGGDSSLNVLVPLCWPSLKPLKLKIPCVCPCQLASGQGFYSLGRELCAGGGGWCRSHTVGRVSAGLGSPSCLSSVILTR